MLKKTYAPQGCNQRGDQCDHGRTKMFRYLNPGMSEAGRQGGRGAYEFGSTVTICPQLFGHSKKHTKFEKNLPLKI